MSQTHTYDQAIKERNSYMDRLIEAGYTVTGGGLNLPFNEWDIFLADPDNPEGEIQLAGPEQVETFLDEGVKS